MAEDEGSVRYNDGKPEMFYWLLWPKSAEAVSRVQTQGAQKYSEFNYAQATEKTNPPKEFLSSAMRHLTKASRFLISRNPHHLYDSESGNLHVAHAVWNLMMLMDFIWDMYPATNTLPERADPWPECEHEWTFYRDGTDENGDPVMFLRCSLCTDTINISKNPQVDL